MKVRGYEIFEDVVDKVEIILRTKENFNRMMLEELLEQHYSSYDKTNFEFIFYDAARRIILLWKKQKLIKKYNNNKNLYWKWARRWTL